MSEHIIPFNRGKKESGPETSMREKVLEKVTRALEPFKDIFAFDYTYEQFLEYTNLSYDDLAYEVERLSTKLESGLNGNDGFQFVDAFERACAIRAVLEKR